MTRTTTMLLAAVLATPGVLGAAPVSDVESLRQAEMRQQQVRAQVGAAGEQLDQVIADFEANGLGEGDDVKLLRELRRMLGALTAEQMQQVIALLQEARTQAASGDGLAPAKEAHERQQRILAEFRRVLAEYQKTQSVYATAARVRELMERQHAAMRSAVDLVKVTRDRLGQSPDERTRASLAVQSAEQRTLAAEAEDLLAALSAMSRVPGVEQGDRLVEAVRIAESAALLDAMTQAGDEVQQFNLFRAAQMQRNARDTLRRLWRQVSPPRDRQRQLQDAALELQQHIEMQAAVTTQTTGAKDKAAYTAVERRQGDLVDRADMTRLDLDLLVPLAADFTREAVRAMQASRNKLDDNKAGAEQDQARAAERLTAARDEVLKELAREEERLAREQSQPSQDRLERTREAIREVQELRQQQERLAQNEQMPAEQRRQEQQRLEARSRDAAARASRDTPQASQRMQEAAGEMRQAEQQMRREPQDSTAGREDQREAGEQLRQAEEELRREESRLTEAERRLEQVEQAGQAVERVMQEQSQASQQSRDAAAQDDPQRREQQSQQAAAEQREARQRSSEAQEQVERASERAGEAMRQSQPPMQEAEADLRQGRPEQSREDQSRAEQGLTEARQELEREADRLREELDRPANDMQQGQAAQEAVERAREQARQQEQAPGQEQAQATQERAGQLERSAAEAGDAVSPEAREAMREAAGEMRESAAQARARDREASSEAARRAQQRLGQAGVSLAEEQARRAEEQARRQQQAQGRPQPGDPDQPGQPGQNPDPARADADRSAQPGGERNATADGSGRYLGLPARERAALEQSQAEKVPEEYAPAVDNYLRNLSKEPKR